jgi:hypothetical protein
MCPPTDVNAFTLARHCGHIPYIGLLAMAGTTPNVEDLSASASTASFQTVGDEERQRVQIPVRWAPAPVSFGNPPPFEQAWE